MKAQVTNEQILIFRMNADDIVRRLTMKNERSRYTYSLQRMLDRLENIDKIINRRLSDLSERHAKLNENGCFIFDNDGQTKSYVYTPDEFSKMKDAKEKFLNEKREIECYHINEENLPKDLSNQLLKVLTPFILTQEVVEKILYGENIIETSTIVN